MYLEKFRLDRKTALVTGAGQGIGLACAEALAEAGAKVVIADRDAKLAETGCASLKAKGLDTEIVIMDVTDSGRVSEVADQLASRYGGIDILVNNAGITKDMLLLRMKKEDWDSVLQTNLAGAFFCAQEAIKVMLKQKYGRIINISSVVGLSGNAGQTNYAASKAGIIGFTKSLALEVASRNITVNAVAPGFIETAMTQGLPETVRSKLTEKIPLARMGTDREVAFGVRFLASDEAGYITGQVLNINGGLYM